MSDDPQTEPTRLAAAAGDSVSAHVQALLSEAERKAESIVAEAAAEAERVRGEGSAESERLAAEALAAATAVLKRVTAIEERLGEVVAELRREALELPSGAQAVAGVEPDELPPSAVPGAAFDVGQLAQNLRSILERPAGERPSETAPPPGGEHPDD